MYKILVKLLVLVMVVVMLAGCVNTSTNTGNKDTITTESSKSNESSKDKEESLLNTSGSLPITNEVVEMNMTITVGATDKSPDDMWFFQNYEKLTNVRWNINPIQKADWAQKKSIMMATQNYTDVLWGLSFNTKELLQYGSDGTFIDLRPYFKYAPDFMAAMGLVEGSWKYITCPDKGVYSLAYVNPTNWLVNQPNWINAKWLKNLGIKKPNTVEGLYNVLKTFKEQDADGDGDPNNEIPLSGVWVSSSSTRGNMLRSFGFDTNGGYTFNIALDTLKNNSVVYIPLTERYREYLAYMNKLYKEELLDQDTFSQDATAFLAKGEKSRIGVQSQNIPFQFDPANHMDYEALLLAYNDNTTPVAYQTSKITPGKFMITDKCKYPEIAMSWINLFYQPEHCFNIMYGPLLYKEDLGTDKDPKIGSYVKLDEDGNYIGIGTPYWEEVKDKYTLWDWYALDHPVNGVYASTIGESYMLDNLFRGRANTYETQLEYNKRRSEQEFGSADNNEGWWRYQSMLTILPYVRYGYPTAYLNVEQQKFVDENATIIEDYVYNMEAKFITGAASIEQEYDSFIKELKRLGAEQYQQIYIDVYIE